MYEEPTVKDLWESTNEDFRPLGALLFFPFILIGFLWTKILNEHVFR